MYELIILGWIFWQHSRILVSFLTRTLLEINVLITPRKLPVRNGDCFFFSLITMMFNSKAESKESVRNNFFVVPNTKSKYKRLQ